MAENFTLARPYAKAIFQIAKESGQYQLWTDLLQCLTMVVQNPQVIALIKSPRLVAAEKLDFIVQLDVLPIDQSRLAFIKLLIENDRFLVVPAIAVLFEKYCAEEKQVLKVVIISAVLLNNEQQEVLTKSASRYFNKKVQITWQIEADLIGGIIIKAQDKVLDGSVRGQLLALKQELLSQ